MRDKTVKDNNGFSTRVTERMNMSYSGLAIEATLFEGVVIDKNNKYIGDNEER